MSFSIKAMLTHSIIIATLHEDFEPQREGNTLIDDLRRFLDQMPEPAGFIMVVDEFDLDFDDAVSLLSLMTQGDLVMQSHPKLKEIAVVTTNDLIMFGAKALGHTQYGALRVTVARTLEEAVALVTQEHIAS